MHWMPPTPGVQRGRREEPARAVPDPCARSPRATVPSQLSLSLPVAFGHQCGVPCAFWRWERTPRSQAVTGRNRGLRRDEANGATSQEQSGWGLEGWAPNARDPKWASLPSRAGMSKTQGHRETSLSFLFRLKVSRVTHGPVLWGRRRNGGLKSSAMGWGHVRGYCLKQPFL